MGGGMNCDVRGNTKSLWYRWGQWASRDGMSRLGYPPMSAEQMDHIKIHEGDFPTEQRVEESLTELGRFDDLALRATILYYTEDKETGGMLSWDEVADRLKCGKKRIKAAHDFTIGFVASALRDLVSN